MNLFLIVTHKLDYKLSKTFISLTKDLTLIKNSTIAVWKNQTSEDKVENLILSETYDIKINIYNSIKNKGLSYIYNYVRRIYDGYKFIILLDQDTELTQNFLMQVNNLQSRYNLYLPIVKNKNLIVSPGKFNGIKGKRIKKFKYGINPSKGFTAINSGMIINFEYFKKIFPGYDERLKFYGIDVFFMKKYSELNDEFFLLNTELQHSSGLLDSNENRDKKIFRIYNLIKSWEILNYRHNIFLWLYIFYAKCKNSIKFKTIIFFKDNRFEIFE